MRHYLLVYARDRGALLEERSYDTQEAALQGRSLAEREYSHLPDVEVAVLSADNHDDLRRTHSRYFRSLRELSVDAVALSVATPARAR